MVTNTAIDLQRLLARLDATLSDPEIAGYDSIRRASIAANVEYARKLLLQLRGDIGKSIQSIDTTYTDHERHIRRLNERLTEMEQMDQDEPSSSEDEAEQAPSVPPTLSSQPSFSAPASELRNRLNRESSTSDSATLSSTEHVLSHHRGLQEEYSTDLLRMARVLKNNSLAFGEKLEEDKSLISDTAALLGKNEGAMKTTGGKLGKYSKQSRGTTCLMCAVLGIVFVMFFFVFMLIRMT
ncbi:hypothetical protein YB2330_002211 [Saitoella coloradoensis]